VSDDHIAEAVAAMRASYGSDQAQADDLATLLDSVCDFVARYVVVTDDQLVAITLWIAHTWVLGAFDATGYLEIRSPVRRCGKSTLLDVLELLVQKPWKTIEPSEAVFYRRINVDTPTLLLDEVDAIFRKKSEATEGLRACLNAGNKRGTTVPRCVPPRMEITEFEVFCAKALAGIGGLPATITDRSIPIEMRRKARSERVERFRQKRAAEAARPLADSLARMGESGCKEIEAALIENERLADDGGPLASLDDRAWEQAWEPLIAVASLAGQEWLKRGIAAAVALSGNRDDELDVGVNLLGDIRAVFDQEPGRESLATYELLDGLLQIEDSPWRDWWSDPRADDVKPSKSAPRKLARTLGPFGIERTDVWMPSGASRKGYKLDSFRDAWARYLPSLDGRGGRGEREPSGDAGFSLAHADPEWAREAANERGGRGGAAQPSRSRLPRLPRPLGENDRDVAANGASGCRHLAQWQARDGRWRCEACTPPIVPGEVVDRRERPA